MLLVILRNNFSLSRIEGGGKGGGGGEGHAGDVTITRKNVCGIKILTVLVLSWKGDTSNIRSSFILQVKQRGKTEKKKKKKGEDISRLQHHYV